MPLPPALLVQICPSEMSPYTLLQSSLLMIGTSTSRRTSLMNSEFSDGTPHPVAVTICPGSGSDPDDKAIVWILLPGWKTMLSLFFHCVLGSILHT